jgi:hypothetical protein
MNHPHKPYERCSIDEIDQWCLDQLPGQNYPESWIMAWELFINNHLNGKKHLHEAPKIHAFEQVYEYYMAIIDKMYMQGEKS